MGGVKFSNCGEFEKRWNISVFIYCFLPGLYLSWVEALYNRFEGHKVRRVRHLEGIVDLG